eukprot:1315812-Pyramimonas_sp.AAC.1
MPQAREVSSLAGGDSALQQLDKHLQIIERACRGRVRTEEEAVADHEHVPKEKGGLHEACHVRSCKVVVEAVAVDEHSGRASAEHGAPPPAVILNCQLEYGQYHTVDAVSTNPLMQYQSLVLSHAR